LERTDKKREGGGFAELIISRATGRWGLRKKKKRTLHSRRFRGRKKKGEREKGIRPRSLPHNPLSCRKYAGKGEGRREKGEGKKRKSCSHLFKRRKELEKAKKVGGISLFLFLSSSSGKGS